MSKPRAYTILKEVKMPTSGRSLGAFLPLKEMEVGDCFRINPIDEKRATALIEAYGKKNGAAFFVNSADDGIYCWRTA